MAVKTLPDVDSMNVRKDESGSRLNKKIIPLHIPKTRRIAPIKVPTVEAIAK